MFKKLTLVTFMALISACSTQQAWGMNNAAIAEMQLIKALKSQDCEQMEEAIKHILQSSRYQNDAQYRKKISFIKQAVEVLVKQGFYNYNSSSLFAWTVQKTLECKGEFPDSLNHFAIRGENGLSGNPYTVCFAMCFQFNPHTDRFALFYASKTPGDDLSIATRKLSLVGNGNYLLDHLEKGDLKEEDVDVFTKTIKLLTIESLFWATHTTCPLDGSCTDNTQEYKQHYKTLQDNEKLLGGLRTNKYTKAIVKKTAELA